MLFSQSSSHNLVPDNHTIIVIGQDQSCYLNDSLNVDAGDVNVFRRNVSNINNLLHLSYRDLACDWSDYKTKTFDCSVTSFAHWLIEIVGCLSEDEIPCLVSLPRLHQAIVPGDGLLHDVVPPAEHSLLSDINIYSNYSSTISVIPRFGVNGNCSIFVVLDWRSSLVNQSPIRCWCEECWHSRATGSDPLRQCSLTQDIMSH